VARIVVYRQYNDYIYWDGTLENVMKLKKHLMNQDLNGMLLLTN
jgi:hypothetical protein